MGQGPEMRGEVDGEIACAVRTVSAFLPSLQCLRLITELVCHFDEFICSSVWFCLVRPLRSQRVLKVEMTLSDHLIHPSFDRRGLE